VIRLSELDGIRGLAALTVVLAHYATITPPTFGTVNERIFWRLSQFSLPNIAVLVFFGLSAFLLAWLAETEIIRTGVFDRRAFLIRRILRICPLYFFVVLVTLVVASAPFLQKKEELGAVSIYGWSYFIFLYNWTVALRMTPMLNELSQLWSLSVEMQFYLLFVFFFGWLRSVNVWKLIAIVVILGTAMRLAFVSLVPHGFLYFYSFSYIEVFALSAVAGILYARGKRLKINQVLPVALILVAGWFWKYSLWGAGSIAFYSVFGVLIAAWLFASKESWLGHPILGKIGGLSYGLYVWHLPVKLFTSRLDVRLVPLFESRTLGIFIMFVIYMVVCFAAAWLTYRFIERPFLAQAKTKNRSPPTAKPTKPPSHSCAS
jgi:peptidoglycan/LPS O-acetylase OafA/YrhL